MRRLIIFLAIMMLCMDTAAAADSNSFRGITWGSDLEAIRNEEPQMAESHMGVMPGVEAFQMRQEDLNFGGIKADAITYIFYKGKFTSVTIDFRGFDNYEKLLAYCKKMYGPVSGTAVMRLEQYASFDSTKIGAMLIYQLAMQTTNYGKLYLYSKDLLDK